MDTVFEVNADGDFRDLLEVGVDVARRVEGRVLVGGPRWLFPEPGVFLTFPV